MVPTALRTKYMLRDDIQDWVDPTGRVVLIGEAAHPLLVGPFIFVACGNGPLTFFYQPCSTQGAGLAVEDAAVLGVLMSHLRAWEQIPQFLEAFQDLRQPRSIEVKASELQNAALCTLPPGEARNGRDAAMRLSSTANPDDDWDDTSLREQYDTIGTIFGYNAIEAAEDWWLKWGILGDTRPPNHVTKDFFSKFAITKVEILQS